VGLPGNTSGKSALLKLQLLAHVLHELTAFVRSFFLQLTERDQGALGFRIFAQTRLEEPASFRQDLAGLLLDFASP